MSVALDHDLRIGAPNLFHQKEHGDLQVIGREERAKNMRVEGSVRMKSIGHALGDAHTNARKPYAQETRQGCAQDTQSTLLNLLERELEADIKRIQITLQTRELFLEIARVRAMISHSPRYEGTSVLMAVRGR